MRRTSAVFLVGLFVFTLGPVAADDDYKDDRKRNVTSDTMNSVSNEGFSLTNKDAPPVGVQARPILELELAIQEYLMYFEAYREARQSSDRAERAKIPQLLRAYRTAYAKALKTLRDDKLVHPMIPQDPLKFYMDKAPGAISGDPKLRRRIYKEIRKAIKDALKDGKSADEIIAIIKEKIAQANANVGRGNDGGSTPGDGSKPPQNPPPGNPPPPNPPLNPPPGSPPPNYTPGNPPPRDSDKSIQSITTVDGNAKDPNVQSPPKN